MDISAPVNLTCSKVIAMTECGKSSLPTVS